MKQSKSKKQPTRDDLAAALPCVVKIVTDRDDVGSAEKHKSGWFGNRDGQALRRRALAGELRGLPRHEAGNSAEVSGDGEARTACRCCSI
jgi:hypothetical protein